MDAAGLDLWLPQGTMTRRQDESLSTIDLVMASYALREQMLTCEVNEVVHTDSDHLPILTMLEKFVNFVSLNLQNKSWMRAGDGRHDASPQCIDDAVEHLLDIVQQAVQESTPWAQAGGPITAGRQNAQRRSNSPGRLTGAMNTQEKEDWQIYKATRNKKGRVIAKTLRKSFRQWVKDTVN